MTEPIYNFGDIVVVEDTLIGVVVKCWERVHGTMQHTVTLNYYYEVYVRSYNGIKEYGEEDVRKFIYDKEIEESI